MDLSRVCGGNYFTATGVIRSPNYPEDYPNNKECVWIIEAQEKHRIILKINHFELESSLTCMYDYLEIR